MTNHTKSTSNFIAWVVAITALLAGLRLVGIAKIPWLWILSPIWISWLAGLFLICVVAMYYFFTNGKS